MDAITARKQMLFSRIRAPAGRRLSQPLYPAIVNETRSLVGDADN